MGEFEEGVAQGDYKLEEMIQMATVAQTADGIEVSGNNFKVNALIGCPDMLLFACSKLSEIQKQIEFLQSCCGEYESDEHDVTTGVCNDILKLINPNQG